MPGDQNKKEIRALNPRGTVPIFVDEGHIALNSALAIITWVQDRHSARGQPLLPPATDEKHRALVGAPLPCCSLMADAR
jgi:glutathione S-transferase